MTDKDAVLLHRRLWEAETILEDLLANFNCNPAPLHRRVVDSWSVGEHTHLVPSGTVVPSEIAERAAAWLGKPVPIVDERKRGT